MTELATDYLGLKLESPLVVAASPLSRDLETVRQLEDAGAAAIVLFSLFEEQLTAVPAGDAQWQALRDATFEPDADEFHFDPDGYLEHIRQAKEAVAIPVIASLNVSARGRWTRYATLMEEAGADAIELDIYKIAAEPTVDSTTIECIYADIIADVKAAVSIPVSVKLSPYFTAMATAAAAFDEAGADGLVLFNRFYQPSIDIERRRLVMSLDLSSSADGRLPLMWIALLKGQVRANLAASGGVHTSTDVVRMIMAGADIVMLCSTLLKNGVEYLGEIRRGTIDWLASHDHDDLAAVRGIMSRVKLTGSPDFLRAGYAKVLSRYW